VEALAKLPGPFRTRKRLWVKLDHSCSRFERYEQVDAGECARIPVEPVPDYTGDIREGEVGRLHRAVIEQCLVIVNDEHSLKATIALVLFARVVTDARYAPVIDAFNRRILPPEPSAIALYASQIRNAGQDLDELLNRPGLGHHLEWSEMWLREMKHIESNPVTLMRFSHFWMTLYTAIHQGLDEHFPPTPER
jgi:hypothetical protein